jgi:hypothetical protein
MESRWPGHIIFMICDGGDDLRRPKGGPRNRVPGAGHRKRHMVARSRNICVIFDFEIEKNAKFC